MISRVDSSLVNVIASSLAYLCETTRVLSLVVEQKSGTQNISSRNRNSETSGHPSLEQFGKYRSTLRERGIEVQLTSRKTRNRYINLVTGFKIGQEAFINKHI
jgi:hypothetical protein